MQILVELPQASHLDEDPKGTALLNWRSENNETDIFHCYLQVNPSKDFQRSFK